jgi:hypothetical protein
MDLAVDPDVAEDACSGNEMEHENESLGGVVVYGTGQNEADVVLRADEPAALPGGKG